MIQTKITVTLVTAMRNSEFKKLKSSDETIWQKNLRERLIFILVVIMLKEQQVSGGGAGPGGKSGKKEQMNYRWFYCSSSHVQDP